jgi:exodeoxyribonuclease VIII
MSTNQQDFAYYLKAKNESVRKRLNIKGGFFWCSGKKENIALSRLALAIDEAGHDESDFAKPLRMHLPVCNDLPVEGVFDTAFCDYYEPGGEDGKVMLQIPGTVPPSSKAAAEARQHIVNGVDTETGEVLNDFGNDGAVLNVDTGEIIPNRPDPTIEANNSPAHPQLTTVATMPFRHRILAQYIGDGEYLYHVDATQKKEIVDLEMNPDNSYIQNLLLAAENVEPFKKATEYDIHKSVNAVKKVFPVDGKKIELTTFIQFLNAWFATDHIDRGLLVKEWVKGNRVTEINRTPSGANAGGGNKTDRLTPLTKTGRDYELAMGLLARKHEFDIYAPPLEIDVKANAIMNLNWSGDDNVLDEFIATSKLFEEMPGGMDYSRACNVATVKTTPENLWKDPAKHLEHLNRVMTETDHAHPDELLVDIACGRSSSPMPMTLKPETPEEDQIGKELAAQRGEYVEGISDPADPKWVKTASNEGEKTEVETPDNVQIQAPDSDEEQAGDALLAGENAMQSGETSSDTSKEEATVEQSAAEILAANAPGHANHDRDDAAQIADSENQNGPEAQQDEPAVGYPAYFEPGRYEGLPNDVYHAANGISSTMLKDARISLMYYQGRHVTKVIPRQDSPTFLFGRVTHSLVLEPEKFWDEYAVQAEMPDSVVSGIADLVAIIKEYNASLPALLTTDELKAWIEERNAAQTPPLPLGNNAEETANIYMSLPESFQRLPPDEKQTASQQKACIKEYNASLPPLLKTSGSRDQLLDQIATVRPEFAESERAKFVPYSVSGSKEQLTEIVRTIRPDIVTAEDWHRQQEQASEGKTIISRDMYQLAKNINDALQADADASWLLNHPERKSEVSYFGFNEDTGLEIRVRPDIEIRLPAYLDSICADLKTISLGYVPQDKLKARLHREIIERGYHISAAMYCDVAKLNTFAWIFVNKDTAYHWVAVVYASVEMLELGRKEYQRLLHLINEATFSGKWSAPIAGKYVDELNDYDISRLDALNKMNLEGQA